MTCFNGTILHRDYSAFKSVDYFLSFSFSIGFLFSIQAIFLYTREILAVLNTQIDAIAFTPRCKKYSFFTSHRNLHPYKYPIKKMHGRSFYATRFFSLPVR